MGSLRVLCFSALLAAALGAAPPAEIVSLTLEEMVATADDAVYGMIVSSRSYRVDSEIDGPENYFTTLTIEGRALSSSRALTVDVTFHGGFVSATEGVFNSEAPSADDVKVGRRVVAFYRWSDEMRANAIVAAHGGIYRAVEGPRGTAVLGRGEGYAIRFNLRESQLETAVAKLYQEKTRRAPK